MTKFIRTCHWIAVVVQLFAMALFLYCYSLFGAPAWLVLAGWSLFYGALSWNALRTRKGGGV